MQIPNNVVGIIVTHEHGDHFDLARLREIVDKNQNTYIYAHVDIIAQLQGLPGKSVASGDMIEVGAFKVRFTGDKHAVIHPDFPVVANLGVLVDNGVFYYPGDSFTLPGTEVETLALPAAAPWLKISEAMDFVTAVKPRKCFPTHNAVLSPEGHQVFNAWLQKACDSIGTELMVLDD